MRLPRGFTLIELLVALFITAILFAMGYGAINQALDHRGAIEEQQARLLALQTTMRLMAQDIGQAAPRPVREPIGDTWEPAFRAEASGQASAKGQRVLMRLTRAGWANPAGIQRPALQRVTYVVENDTLRREHSVVLDATLASKTVSRELLTGVHAATLRFMDGGRQWVDQWPGQNVGPQQPAGFPQPQARERVRPLAVEVTLELDDWGKLVRLFEIPQ